MLSFLRWLIVLLKNHALLDLIPTSIDSTESRTSPWNSTPDFSPDFDEQRCVNRSWTDEKSFYELEAGLMKVFSLTRSWIDEKILVYVVKMWQTLHDNDINQNLGPNI